jgi:hypothetical protein
VSAPSNLTSSADARSVELHEWPCVHELSCVAGATPEEEGDMATATMGRCPHCDCNLTYLEGVSGGTMKPTCPRCQKEVTVKVATLLAADYSRR